MSQEEIKLSAIVNNDYPRIPLNLRDYKLDIAIEWGVLIFTSWFLPIILYFILKYPAHAEPHIYLSIGSLGYGLATLFSISKRFYRLTSPSPFYRPLRSSRWQLDYFQYNMVFGFVVITLVIILSVSLPEPIPRLAAMPHALLLFQVTLQLVFAATLVGIKARFPFTFSSMPRSEPARCGVYIIVEDVIAVDGGQGVDFRRQLNARYQWSEDIRRLMFRLDIYWGFSGLALATLLTAAIFTIPNHDAVFVLGWSVPWIWAIFSAGLTTLWLQKTLRMERARLNQPPKDPWFPPTRFVGPRDLGQRPVSGLEIRFSNVIENFDPNNPPNPESFRSSRSSYPQQFENLDNVSFYRSEESARGSIA